MNLSEAMEMVIKEEQELQKKYKRKNYQSYNYI